MARPLAMLAMLPWPWLRLFLGGRSNGSFSFATGLLTCETVAGVLLAGSVWFSVWASQQGLAGNFAADQRPSAPRAGTARFGKEPLYRKEFLWFVRDRSAIVQTILIPLTVASLQAFNLRGVLSHAQNSWNYLCGVAIFLARSFCGCWGQSRCRPRARRYGSR